MLSTVLSLTKYSHQPCVKKYSRYRSLAFGNISVFRLSSLGYANVRALCDIFFCSHPSSCTLRGPILFPKYSITRHMLDALGSGQQLVAHAAARHGWKLYQRCLHPVYGLEELHQLLTFRPTSVNQPVHIPQQIPNAVRIVYLTAPFNEPDEEMVL